MGAGDEWPPMRQPNVVVVGRSNVGKTSLINHLVERSKFLPTGKTPGRTRALFVIELPEFQLIDLPGYGFAKVARGLRESWKQLIDDYFQQQAEQIALVIVLLDCRITTADDRMVIDWLLSLRLPIQLVLTKVDKLGRSLRQQSSVAVTKLFRDVESVPLLYTIKEGACRDLLRRRIAEALDTYRNCPTVEK